MSKKAKFIPCLVISREGMDAAVADIVNLKLEITKETAEMEKEIAAIQKKYQPKILALSEAVETKEVGVMLFCEKNRDTLFPQKKSLELLVAEVGFEMNPPKVEKRRSKESWGVIAKRLLTLPWGESYVREADPEVDKQALISNRKTLTAEQLKEAGVDIIQEEQFFIRPKSEIAAATTVITEEAA